MQDFCIIVLSNNEVVAEGVGGPGDPLMTNNQPTFPDEPASLGQHRSGEGMADNWVIIAPCFQSSHHTLVLFEQLIFT